MVSNPRSGRYRGALALRASILALAWRRFCRGCVRLAFRAVESIRPLTPARLPAVAGPLEVLRRPACAPARKLRRRGLASVRRRERFSWPLPGRAASGFDANGRAGALPCWRAGARAILPSAEERPQDLRAARANTIPCQQ